jgi:hypothetical protein
VRPALAVVVAGVGDHARAVLVEPGAPAQGVESRRHRIVQREQVAHVVRGVVQLRRRQWPAHPVRAGLALVQGDAGHVLHQPLVAGTGADAGQGRGDLGIEQRRRHRVAGAAQRHQVFAGAVHDLLDRRVQQHPAQRLGDARCQRVDQQHLRFGAVPVVDGQLHQCQLRPVGAFADEFGVQPDAGAGLVEVGAELCGFGDPEGR